MSFIKMYGIAKLTGAVSGMIILMVDVAKTVVSGERHAHCIIDTY